MALITNIVLLLIPFWILVIYDLINISNKKHSFIKRNLKKYWKEFIASFNKKVITITLIDILFIVAVSFVFITSANLFQSEVNELGEKTNLDAITSKLQQGMFDEGLGGQMEESVNLMRNFFIKLGISIAVIYLLTVLLLTLFKGWIWTILTGTKITFNYLKKLFLLNLVLVLILAAVFLFIASSVSPSGLEEAVAVFTILAIYFGYMIYYYFTKEPKLKTAWNAVGLGFKRPKHFVIPYVFLLILFVVAATLYNLFLNIPFIGMFLGILVFILFLSFAKVFFVRVAKS